MFIYGLSRMTKQDIESPDIWNPEHPLPCEGLKLKSNDTHTAEKFRTLNFEVSAMLNSLV